MKSIGNKIATFRWAMARLFPLPFSNRVVTSSAAGAPRLSIIISAPNQAPLQLRNTRSDPPPHRDQPMGDQSPPNYAHLPEGVPTPFTQAGEVTTLRPSEETKAPAVTSPTVLAAAENWISALKAAPTPTHSALSQQWNALSAMVQSMHDVKDDQAIFDRVVQSQIARRISIMKRELHALPRTAPYSPEEQRCVKRLRMALTHFESLAKRSIVSSKQLARERLLEARNAVDSALQDFQLIRGKRCLIARASAPFLIWQNQQCDSAVVNATLDEFFDDVCKQTDDVTMASMLGASHSYAGPWLATKLQQASDRSKVLAAAENWIGALTAVPTFGEDALNNQWNELRTSLQNMYKKEYVRASDAEVLRQITSCIAAVAQDIGDECNDGQYSPDERLRVQRLRAALTRFDDLSKQLLGSNNQLPQERILEAYYAVGNALRDLLQFRNKPALIARASAPFFIWQTDLCNSADVNADLDAFFDKVCSKANDVTMASMLRASQKYAGPWLTTKLQQADNRFQATRGNPRTPSHLSQLAKNEATEISILDELRKVATTHYSSMNDTKGIEYRGINQADAQILADSFASVSRISGEFVTTLYKTGFNLFNAAAQNGPLGLNQATTMSLDDRHRIMSAFVNHVIEITPHALQVTSMQARFTLLASKFFNRLTGRYQLTPTMTERLYWVAQRQIHYRNFTLELSKTYADALHHFEEDYPEWANDANLTEHYNLLKARRDIYVNTKLKISAAADNYNANVKVRERLTTKFAVSPVVPAAQ